MKPTKTDLWKEAMCRHMRQPIVNCKKIGSQLKITKYLEILCENPIFDDPCVKFVKINVVLFKEQITNAAEETHNVETATRKGGGFRGHATTRLDASSAFSRRKLIENSTSMSTIPGTIKKLMEEEIRLLPNHLPMIKVRKCMRMKNLWQIVKHFQTYILL